MNLTRIVTGFLAVSVLIGNSVAMAENSAPAKRSRWQKAGSDTVYKPEDSADESKSASEPAPITIPVPKDCDQPEATVMNPPPSGNMVKVAVALVAIPVVTYILYKAFFPAAAAGGMLNYWSHVVQQATDIPFGQHYGDDHVPTFNDGIDQEVSDYFANVQ
jgi:hypothetical protein